MRLTLEEFIELYKNISAKDDPPPCPYGCDNFIEFVFNELRTLDTNKVEPK